MSGPRVKNWCFTLNNYTPEDLDRLSTLPDGVIYLIYGKEVGSSGTPHLQGTVCFQSRKRLPQVKQVIGAAHCTTTRFLSQSIEYCKKEGDFVELGEAPAVEQGNGRGKRSDLDEFKETVKGGVTDLSTLRDLHSSVCAMYPRFVKEYVDDCKAEIEVRVCIQHPLSIIFLFVLTTLLYRWNPIPFALGNRS